jgi:hypothetical protein
MTTHRNAIELEMLTQLYYSAEPINFTRSSAHGAAAHRLVNSGVAVADATLGLKITAKGNFFVTHLLSIPYPEEIVEYIIPKVL